MYLMHAPNPPMHNNATAVLLDLLKILLSFQLVISSDIQYYSKAVQKLWKKANLYSHIQSYF